MDDKWVQVFKTAATSLFKPPKAFTNYLFYFITTVLCHNNILPNIYLTH